MAIAGSWFALRRTGDSGRAARTTTETAPRMASLDLRPLAITRSEEQKAAATPLEVPRGRLNATILLPVGSSPGAYEVRILDSDLRVRASTTGSAEIRNYITTLEAVIDVSALHTGDYQLTLRREGGEWQMFPFECAEPHEPGNAPRPPLPIVPQYIGRLDPEYPQKRSDAGERADAHHDRSIPRRSSAACLVTVPMPTSGIAH